MKISTTTMSPHPNQAIRSKPVKEAAHKRTVYNTSEFIGIVHVLLAWILQRVHPLHLLQLSGDAVVGGESFSAVLTVVTGALLLLAGVAVLRWTHRELARYDQPHEPGIPTTRLIPTGPFAYSRNPTYTVIAGLFVPAVALLWRNPWALLLLPIHVGAVHHQLIRGEEAYLRQKFPDEWRQYCQKTRRWI